MENLEKKLRVIIKVIIILNVLAVLLWSYIIFTDGFNKWSHLVLFPLFGVFVGIFTLISTKK